MSEHQRLTPLPREQRDPVAQGMLAKLGDLGELNLFTTLVRHPTVFKPWVMLGSTVLLRGLLVARDRELLILRTAHLCGCSYEWAQHVEIAIAAGLTEFEIELIRDGPDHKEWSPFDAALLRAADELYHDNRISDATWADLTAKYSDKHLIEVIAVGGTYRLTAYFINSAGVEVEGERGTSSDA